MNVPLKDGIDDQSYAALFKPVMSKLIEVYQPTAVVFQSGVSPYTAALLKTAQCTAELDCLSCALAGLLHASLVAAVLPGSCCYLVAAW